MNSLVLSRKLTAQLIAAILSQGLSTSQAARFPIKEMLTCHPPTAMCLPPDRKGTCPPRQGWMCYLFLCLWSPWDFLFPDLLPILGSQRPGLEERAWNPSEDGFLSQVAVVKPPIQQSGLPPCFLPPPFLGSSHSISVLQLSPSRPPPFRSLEAYPVSMRGPGLCRW